MCVCEREVWVGGCECVGECGCVCEREVGGWV